MIENISQLITDFVSVAKISGFEINSTQLQHESLPAPHQPKMLRKGLQAIYIFSVPSLGNKVLKVGKAGPNTQARFLSQHYNAKSSRSNLAKSLLTFDGFWKEIGQERPTQLAMGSWIKYHTDRDNILMSSSLVNHLLSLLEIFLICRLNPLFEGSS